MVINVSKSVDKIYKGSYNASEWSDEVENFPKEVTSSARLLRCGAEGWGMRLQREVQFSHSVVSDSLRPHELQHARPPCPSPTPRLHPNPCPLSR